MLITFKFGNYFQKHLQGSNLSHNFALALINEVTKRWPIRLSVRTQDFHS